VRRRALLRLIGESDERTVVVDHQEPAARFEVRVVDCRRLEPFRLSVRVTPARRHCLPQRGQEPISPTEDVVAQNSAVQSHHAQPPLALIER
jgi:hypothetical protein